VIPVTVETERSGAGSGAGGGGGGGVTERRGVTELRAVMPPPPLPTVSAASTVLNIDHEDDEYEQVREHNIT